MEKQGLKSKGLFETVLMTELEHSMKHDWPISICQLLLWN